MVVCLHPEAIALTISPTADSVAACVCRDIITVNLRGGTLPQYRIGGIPSTAPAVKLKILEGEAASLDIHIVKEDSCGP